MTKNYCERCKQETNHNVIFSKSIGSKPDDDFHWGSTYEVIECCGCELIKFRETYADESMVHYDYDGNEREEYDEQKTFPPYIEKHEIISNLYSIPYKIRTIYLETIQAFKANSLILTGVGFRAIIEAICIEENILGNNLQEKTNNLLAQKLITQKEANRLHSIRFLGNDSIHEMLVPDIQLLRIVLTIIEHLLENLYTIDSEANSLLETVINKYGEFEEIIWYRANSFNNGEEKSIKEILGKHLRRIDHNDTNPFIERLIARITQHEIEWLSISSLASSNNLLEKKFVINK